MRKGPERVVGPNANATFRDLARTARDIGMPRLCTLLESAFRDDERNAVSHADYVIRDDGLRLRKRNGGHPAKVTFEEMSGAATRALAFFEQLADYNSASVRSYAPPKTVVGRFSENPPMPWTIAYDPARGTFGISGSSPGAVVTPEYRRQAEINARLGGRVLATFAASPTAGAGRDIEALIAGRGFEPHAVDLDAQGLEALVAEISRLGVWPTGRLRPKAPRRPLERRGRRRDRAVRAGRRGLRRRRRRRADPDRAAGDAQPRRHAVPPRPARHHDLGIGRGRAGPPQARALATYSSREQIARIDDFARRHRRRLPPTVFFRGQLLELMRWTARHARNLPGDGNGGSGLPRALHARRPHREHDLVRSRLRRPPDRDRRRGPRHRAPAGARGDAPGGRRGQRRAAPGVAIGRGFELFTRHLPPHLPDFEAEFEHRMGLTIGRGISDAPG